MFREKKKLCKDEKPRKGTKLLKITMSTMGAWWDCTPVTDSS